MAATYNIRITRGDDWAGAKFRWKDSEGVVVPLTSARMQFRPSADSSTLLLELTTEVDGGLVIDDDDYVVPTITAAQSADLRDGRYDVEVTATSGDVKTIAAGTVSVTADVSRG
jgi:hypothetical protein